MSFAARILLDSIGPTGARLTTFEMVMPRIVLAEFNTHRMFSRNSASSRAIPVEKMLARVREHPFVPDYWGKNQKGMQADEELSPEQAANAERVWREASNWALSAAVALSEIGVHKQITNRLLEPWLWHTVVFTATELDNFRALRADRHAQPEIRKPTEMLFEAYDASKPMELQAGEWHLPLVTNYDLFRTSSQQGTWKRPSWKEPDRILDQAMNSGEEWLYWAAISAGRCARTSYLTHEGKRDLSEDSKMHDNLVKNGHMSPLEHPAEALGVAEWRDLGGEAVVDWVMDRVPVGNFWGWQQYRKTFAHEHNFADRKRLPPV